MQAVERISPEDTRTKVENGQALLVCAYEDPEKFSTVRLEGAISMQEFRLLRTTMSKDQETVFYCA